LIEHEPRLMPHLHMSLQAGDNMILKRMKRRHTREDAIAMASRARKARPEIGFGADIIAGFPTETDEMFENSMKIVEECDLTFLHIFPYSEREGTPAAKIPAKNQVPVPIRKERAKRLREAGDKQLQKFLKENLNKEMNIIIEKNGFGRAENFAPVKIDQKLESGTLVRVRTKAIEKDRLVADIF